MQILIGPPAAAEDFDLVTISGGSFIMGDAAGDPNEHPRPATVGPFRIMRFEVTNAQFRRFVGDTKYVTDAESHGAGWTWTDSWHEKAGADWRHPFGPESSIDGRDRHPVVQVSQQDAEKFCLYYNMRLPTEAEWEFAARGTDGRRFPWGNDPPTQGTGIRRANFGTVSCCAADASDGFKTTAPVGSFPEGRSPFGLYDMAGNVWEWTSDSFPGRSGEVTLHGGGWGNDPYCLRVSYRHGNPPNIGLDMVGFRCVQNIE